MTISTTFALFIALIVLAAIPGPGIMVVVARTLANGFRSGVTTSMGIVAGDFIFIALSVFGLSALSQTLGGFFMIVKYLGAMYLLWVGIKIIISKELFEVGEAARKLSHSTDFFAGLLTTLSNPKAILFYVSFFPAFLNLSSVGYVDVGIIFLTTTVAVGGVMVSYVFLANRSSLFLRKKAVSRGVKYSAGTMLLVSGAYVALRSDTV